MNTMRSIISINTYRLSPRLRLIATRLGSLMLLFQRMPVVQYLFPEANIIGGASVANTISLAVTTVVGLGVFDSVSGQTTVDEVLPVVKAGPNPASVANAINVPATVSDVLSFQFKCSTAPSAVKSWRCTTNGVAGTLPAGLSPAAVSPVDSPTKTQVHTISGTPLNAGIHPVTLTVYRYYNGNSTGTGTPFTGQSVAQLFNICVLGFTAVGQPVATQTISYNTSAALSCIATGNPAATPAHPGNGTLTYEWYQGTTGTIGTILGTSSSFTTPLLTAGTSYWVRLKSVLGTSTVYANSTTATVNVTPAYTSWASVLPVGQNGPLQTPQNDGVTNLQKFAFNMDPIAPDVGQLTVGAGGTTGLPGGAVVGGKLRIEYLRRKASSNPGITYMPQFTSTLGGWVDFSGTETVGTAPAPFERVTVEDTIGGPARFGRVKVVKSP